jgi:hypothetical protein
MIGPQLSPSGRSRWNCVAAEDAGSSRSARHTLQPGTPCSGPIGVAAGGLVVAAGSSNVTEHNRSADFASMTKAWIERNADCRSLDVRVWAVQGEAADAQLTSLRSRRR